MGFPTTLTALLLGLTACGGTAPADTAGPTRDPAVTLSPGPAVRLGPEDDIVAADLAVDPAGGLHVTWRETDRHPDGTGVPSGRTLYSRRASGAGTWSPPEELPITGDPRLAILPGGAVVAVGENLIPWRREPGLSEWRALPPLTPPLARPAATYDLAMVDGALAAAYVTRAGRAAPLVLSFARAGGGPPTVLATAESAGFDALAPRLLYAGERLHLLWAVNRLERERVTREGRTSERFTPGARLLHFAGGGQGWSQAVELVALGTAAGGGAAGTGTIAGVELVATPEGCSAVYAAHGLYAVPCPGPGRPPGTPIRLTPPVHGLGAGTTVRSPAAAGGALAWVDNRLRETDRRWWRPLGGLPWSDDPDGADDDVFLLAGDDLTAALRGAAATPRRLTPDLTTTSVLRLTHRGERIVVLRAGRREVGKHAASRGTAPELRLLSIEP